jgi:hypothetical protein
MTDKTKLGYVTFPAAYVFEHAIDAKSKLLDTREKKRLEFIENIKQKPTKRRFWPGKALTNDEAIAFIQGELWLCHEYFYLTPEWQSDRLIALDRLIDVSCCMIQRSIEQENTDMTLTIEAANMIL